MNGKEVNRMKLINCKKCNRAFMPNTGKVVPLTSGRGFIQRERKKENETTCPYCGHKQEVSTFLVPL
jgi:DNA-directed RNA polymerase subunit RPC12/RpoP